MIDFIVTNKEQELIDDVTYRTQNMISDDTAYKHIQYDAIDQDMDLKSVHKNGCPLDFERLLHFSNQDFVHDILGILRHINLQTGKLENCFLPRCAKPDDVKG